MIHYEVFKIVHALAAVAATGPLLFAPWLSARLKNCSDATKPLLLGGLAFSDRLYNVAGWGLILSGILMFWLKDWQRSFEVWFLLSVAIFTLDSVFEKRLRDPANEVLEATSPGAEQWLPAAQQIHLGVVGQATCTSLILLVMLLQSHLELNLLTLKIF
ncbi:hypothetical protein [Pseudomonas brassicacearum]|uniref:DUF2269 family protein n=1 Tax=Pseudomonas brassicacearum TaxID=930166 RepID=A0A423GRM9_9PSED|nr:hypothetical protein [Pseudomonas brassicacearum]ROM97178.1 hypothetical protein BK658_13170 [Pseudomonas brassicacearum]